MKKYILAVILLFSICMIFSGKAMAGSENCAKRPESQEQIADDSDYAAIRESIKTKLDAMVDAYTSRRLNAFMRQVSGDFAEDEDYLDSSVRNDFYKYSYIDITCHISSVIPDNKNKYAVNISFSRKLEDRKTGVIKSDYGSTTLIFVKHKRGLKLYSQRSPRLFGIN